MKKRKTFGIGLVFTLSLSLVANMSFAQNEQYVRISIKGKNVNLRPQPYSSGRILVQMNTGDVFIAEKERIHQNFDNSEWYKIVLAIDSKSNMVCTLLEKDARLFANIAFVHTDFATVSPLTQGDMAKIKASSLFDEHPVYSIVGVWNYLFTTKGEKEENEYISELDHTYTPRIQIGKDNSVHYTFYETDSKGEVRHIDHNAFSFSNITSQIEGHDYYEANRGYFQYLPQSGLLRHTYSGGNDSRWHHYFAPEETDKLAAAALKAYQSVLKNETIFLSANNMKHYRLNYFNYWEPSGDQPVTVSRFAVVDMDNDGVPEVVLALTNGYDGAFEVLRYNDYGVTGFYFVFRALLNLSQNGTFMGSGGADDCSYHRLSFPQKDVFEKETLAYSKSGQDNRGNPTISYFIGDTKVTEEVFNAFEESLPNNNVVWYDFTEANIQKALSGKAPM